MLIRFSFVLLMVGIWGCRSSQSITKKSDSDEFKQTSIDFYQQLDQEKQRPFFPSVRGKARSILNSEGQSERFIIEFESDRISSVLHLKNTVGINAATIIVTPDSIIEINHLEKRIVRGQSSTYALRTTGLDYPLHIYPFLKPLLLLENPEDFQWVEDHWEVTTEMGTTFFITQDLRVEELVHSTLQRSSFERIQFNSYGTLSGHTIPRKITMSSARSKSNLLLMIASLQTMQDSTIQLPSIPSNYTIIQW